MASSSQSSSEFPAHRHELLGDAFQWHFRESIRIPSDLGRCCKANSAIEFIQDTKDVNFCILFSSGCSHIATVVAKPSERSIEVTVYQLQNGFEQKWTVDHSGAVGDFQTSESSSWYDTAQMHGGVTEDGQTVLLVYRPPSAISTAYIVNANGFTLRRPPSDVDSTYSLSTGELSDDGDYIFYTRSGSSFGRNGEAKVVEVYSIRHLARVKAVTFGFGDGRHLRNVRLLSQLRVDSPIYMAIATSSFDGEEGERNSPPLIVSSDRKLHFNIAGIDHISTTGGSNTTISDDGNHLFYIQRDEAMLHHWDLKHPTLKPLGSVRLPGVEFGQARRWIIHGKETTVKDAIPEQLHYIRYSSKCKIVTIITVNDAKVVVNVLLTFNLQLVYHQIVENPGWPECVPFRIGFSDSAGLNVCAMYPTTASQTSNGLLQLFGVSGILISLPEIFAKIKGIESYFESTSDRITRLIGDVDGENAQPHWKFSWRPGVVDRDDPAAIALEHGPRPFTTEVDAQRQRSIYDRVFANPKSSVRMDSTSALRHYFVPHLFSFEYTWATKQRVSVFGIVMKNEYHIFAIGPSPSDPRFGAEVVRALYATDIKVLGDAKQEIEVYKNGPNFILRVFERGDRFGHAYSGAPMPSPRWTVISPHFLEEDAWYDTFLIHRAKHVTMPTGWSHTPNEALIFTASYYAYFKPYTFASQLVTDYGHRARSAYVLPKYTLWREYGLRGLQTHDSTNEIFLGGGRYIDHLGNYYNAIYDDKTYDDISPLFPSTLAVVCNADHRAQKTDHVDAFFRRLHQDRNLLLENSHAISCTLPLATRTRPMASLSFMRHIVLYRHVINDIGAVEVKYGATKPIQGAYGSRWHKWHRLFEDFSWFITALWARSQYRHPEPNQSRVTLPLPGFCSFYNKLYKAPPVSWSRSSHDDPLWEFTRATMPSRGDVMPRWDTQILKYVQHSGRGAASPFTRLVEEILDMKGRDVQLSYLRVVWVEKLLAWKMQTFGLQMYITRTAIPMLALFFVHLTIGILSTGTDSKDHKNVTVSVRLLGSVEAVVSCYILYVKVRQLYLIPRLFVRSIFNYIDGTALSLGLITFLLTVSGRAPSRPFLGFSTLLIWIAAVLMLRVYRPVGMLLLLLTETLRGVLPFLVLLSFIILGFAFVPFLLLRNLAIDGVELNPFSSFPLALSQMLNFIASDYGALTPFQPVSAAIIVLQALYIIVITILLLNALIAILNLKMKQADKNAANLYHLQMASLQVEIELGLLSSAERARREWFPVWFSYSMTETEKRKWEDYLEKNPLKWTDENNFGEDKDHAPLIPVVDEKATSKQAQPLASGAPASSDLSSAEKEKTKSSSNSVATSQKQVSGQGSIQEYKEPRDHGIPVAPEDPWESCNEDDSAEVSQKQRPPSEKIQDSSSIETSCKICGKPGKLCLGCKVVAYCSKEHQSQDWKLHKSVCKGKQKA